MSETLEISDWKSCFPYPEPRQDQPRIIEKILNAFINKDKRFAILEAPTGTGKSAIGYTIGRFLKEYYYITAQKILQSQLNNDFGENGKWSNDHPMIELKGRNAYKCDYYRIALEDPEHPPLTDSQIERFRKLDDANTDCAKGECKRKGKSSLKYCRNKNICQYFNQVNKATMSDAVLMNFHSFIFQTEFVKDRWPKKTLLIIDECHNAEQVLMDYVSFKINDLNYDFDLPKFDNAEEYLMFFEEIGLLDTLKINLEEAMSVGNSDDEEYWVKQIQKYEHFKSSIEHHEWISCYEQKTLIKTSDNKNKKYREIELKPLFISDFAEDLLFGKADYILMMSATILNVDILCESLGIDRSLVYATRINSDFPVENRPIYYTPSGNMSFREKESTLPKMIKDVEKICEKYNDDKGIIHTHNFEIAEYIKNNIAKKYLERLFYQTEFDNKDIMLSIHSKSQNGIIVAPAMHEGLDLKDDLSRFQIICKVPYPGLGNNPQLKRRMELSDEYYSYLSALKLVQQYGRSIRSKDDYADTYILDSGFKSFFSRAKNMMPKWFMEAIIWD